MREYEVWEWKQDVVFVEGEKRAAVYDFRSGDVYWLDEEGKSIAERCILHGERASGGNERKFIEEIRALGLYHGETAHRYLPSVTQTPLTFGWIEVTQKCNLRCVHCYEGTRHEAEGELTREDWRRVLLELKNEGCFRVQFIGGEPCCNKDLENLVRYACELSFGQIEIFTNATFFSDELTNLCRENKIHVRVSLYGDRAQIHETITGVRGSFQKTVDTVRRLRESGIKVSIAVVLMKENINERENIIAFLNDLKIDDYKFDVIRKVAGGIQNRHLVSRKEEVKYACRTEPVFRAEKEWFARAMGENTCWAGKLAVSSDGSVYPCVFERNLSLGNVRKQNLHEIVCGETALRYRKLHFGLIEKCCGCEFRFACSDCRPLASAESGNLFAKNPRCLYDPSTGIWNKGTSEKNKIGGIR